MNKQYHIQYNIGKAKYLVSWHDGVKTHPDGSLFFDITIFNNKIKLNKYIKSLQKEGYSKNSSLQNT